MARPKRPAPSPAAATPAERSLQEQQAELMARALNEPQILEVREAMEQYNSVPQVAYTEPEIVAYFGVGANPT